MNQLGFAAGRLAHRASKKEDTKAMGRYSNVKDQGGLVVVPESKSRATKSVAKVDVAHEALTRTDAPLQPDEVEVYGE
ncbi:MAG: hypothetical protein Q9188_002768 [Gyalolechia gomerana]